MDVVVAKNSIHQMKNNRQKAISQKNPNKSKPETHSPLLSQPEISCCQTSLFHRIKSITLTRHFLFVYDIQAAVGCFPNISSYYDPVFFLQRITSFKKT